MGISFKLATRYLWLNKARTILIITGIVLAAFLLTVVSVLGTSLNKSLIDTTIRDRGSWQYCFYDMSEEKLNDLRRAGVIEQYATLDKNVQSIPIDAAINEERTYFHIAAVSPAYFSLQPIKILQGNIPQNADEIVIPYNMASDYPSAYKIGDTVNIGKVYKVVGISQPERLLEANFAQGYALFTGDSGEFKGKTVYITIKNVKQEGKLFLQSLGEGTGHPNAELLDAMGIMRGESVGGILKLVITMLVAIIVVMAVLLIGNTFLISITERTKEYALLAAVGAGSHKVTLIVLCEGLLLSAVAIPIGIGIGIGMVFLSLSTIARWIAAASYINIAFSLSIDWVIIAAIFGLSLFIVILSSLITIIKHIKTSTISAIRQNKEITIKNTVKEPTPKNTCNKKPHIKKRKLSTQWNIKWELTFKNFVRFKKKYIFIISSAVFCMALLISTFTFTDYSIKSLTNSALMSNYDINCSHFGEGNLKNAINTIYKPIAAISGIKESVWRSQSDGGGAKADNDAFSPEAKAYFHSQGRINIASRYYCISDENFKELTQKLDKNPSDYFDANNLRALSYSNFLMHEDVGGSYKEHKLPMFKGDKAHIELSNLSKDAEDSRAANNVESHIENGGEITVESSFNIELSIISNTDTLKDYGIIPQDDIINVIFPIGMADNLIVAETSFILNIDIIAPNHTEVAQAIKVFAENSKLKLNIHNAAESFSAEKNMFMIIDVFAAIFIIFVSLIVAINIFNTNFTSAVLRKREFAVMRSVGMADKDIKVMLLYENIIMGGVAVVVGLSISAIISYIMLATFNDASLSYKLPLVPSLASSCGVIIIMIVSSLFSARKVTSCNIAESVKSE